MERVDICPQSIYRFRAEDSLTNRIKELLENESYINNDTNYMSVDNRLEKRDEYKEFVDWSLTCVQKIKNIYNYECEKFSITQMWANRADYGNWHHGHYHHYSYISGVFYASESNSSTWFSMTDHWCSLGRDDMKIDRHLEGKSQLVHKEPSVVGKLILFPSKMFHSVDEHLIKENPRYTISFNVFPSGKVGNFFLLAGLDLTIN